MYIVLEKKTHDRPYFIFLEGEKLPPFYSDLSRVIYVVYHALRDRRALSRIGPRIASKRTMAESTVILVDFIKTAQHTIPVLFIP